jgi:hypothetical protein
MILYRAELTAGFIIYKTYDVIETTTKGYIIRGRVNQTIPKEGMCLFARDTKLGARLDLIKRTEKKIAQLEKDLTEQKQILKTLNGK